MNENRSKIYEIMWNSKAGCVGLDEKTCLDLVWRLCDLITEERMDHVRIQPEVFKAHASKIKSQIPETFRRSFVKALLEMERQAALLGIVTGILVLLLVAPAVFYFLFTEAGRSVLPYNPYGWLTSKWMLAFTILLCLCGVGDVLDKAFKIKNAPQRARDLEKLLL